MSYDLIFALASFGLVTSVTPGPNNMMLLASGVNFGFRRSLGHLLGVVIGFGLMVVLVGLGLAGLFLAEPKLMLALKIASVIYMLWLAWKIAHSAAPQEAGAAVKGKPLNFLQAAGFQWVNPKAWAMALTAVTVYAGGQGWDAMVMVGFVLLLAGLPAAALWLVAGQQLRRWLTNDRRLRLFNWGMAVLLVLSLYPVLWP